MSLINTIHGKMAEQDLHKRIMVSEDEKEFSLVVEYRLGEELVHRSAAVILKQPLEIAAALVGVGNVGG